MEKRLIIVMRGREALIMRYNSLTHYIFGYEDFGDKRSLEELAYHLRKMSQTIRQLKQYDTMHAMQRKETSSV